MKTDRIATDVLYRPSAAAAAIVVIGALCLSALPAPAQLSVIYTTIADTSTAIPEGTGTFVATPVDPCVWFRNVAFGGAGSGGQEGIYLFVDVAGPIPPPIKVADMNTPIPGGVENFTDLPIGPALWESSVSFFGAGSGGQQGIYLSTDVAFPSPPPIKIADLATPIPEGTGNFTGFPTGPAIGSDAVVFIGNGSGGQQGVYLLPQPPPIVPVPPPIRLVDTSTEIPNGFGNFTGFVPPNPITLVPPPISENYVAFFGAGIDGQQGIYLVDIAMPSPPPIVPLADINTAIPGSGVGNFGFFEQLAMENADVAFVGGGLVVEDGSMDAIFQKGVYTVIGGTVAKVADLNTSIPGQDGFFTDFGAVAIGVGQVVFVGFGEGGLKGLYTNFGGSLSKVVQVSDPLGGKQVTDVSFGPFGFSVGEVAFRAAFADGSQAVIRATFCTGLQFAGFHAPIGGADGSGGSAADPLRTFKLKSTIPIKMTLTLCDGTPVTDGVHTLEVVKWTSAVESDAAVDATPTDAATPGNQFRLTDAFTGAWHFNLDTKAAGMTRGTWQIIVTLANGSEHTVFISLK